MFGKKTQPKILIVEDETYNHPLYRKAFEEAGFQTIICQNADDDFIAEVLEFDPDIISMDLMIGKKDALTKRDGFAAMSLLNTDERTRDIPVIVLTNFFQEDKVKKAQSLGAVDFINVQGNELKKIPQQYLDYLKNPNHYQPTHPLFRDSRH